MRIIEVDNSCQVWPKVYFILNWPYKLIEQLWYQIQNDANLFGTNSLLQIIGWTTSSTIDHTTAMYNFCIPSCGVWTYSYTFSWNDRISNNKQQLIQEFVSNTDRWKKMNTYYKLKVESTIFDNCMCILLPLLPTFIEQQ